MPGSLINRDGGKSANGASSTPAWGIAPGFRESDMNLSAEGAIQSSRDGASLPKSTA
jgi:hypothetical protein